MLYRQGPQDCFTFEIETVRLHRDRLRRQWEKRTQRCLDNERFDQKRRMVQDCVRPGDRR